jgi:hypothetical protein
MLQGIVARRLVHALSTIIQDILTAIANHVLTFPLVFALHRVGVCQKGFQKSGILFCKVFLQHG